MSKELVIIKEDEAINALAAQIEGVVSDARTKVAGNINSIMVHTYWLIGRYIVEDEQGGHAYAKYGAATLSILSQKLRLRLGKGFSRPNLSNMRKFYLLYPICQTLSDKLGWSHICELIKIEDKQERSFYEHECVNAHWDVRSLKRQISSSLYLRLAASSDKQGVLALSEKGITIDTPQNTIRNSYTLEFCGLPTRKRYSERQLEAALIKNLETFLLELGRGFTFVGRQYHFVVNNTNYYVDLVFYHRILKCFVLIDLKREAVKHKDIGQMNMYLGYFAKEENVADDNPPIGIVLCRQKDELLVEYATYGMDSNIFVSKYELYLPNKEELQAIVDETLES